MQELMLKPTIFKYDTVKEFVDEFKPGKGDLVITNEYIYNPYFGQMNLECDVIFQEKYGAGEPSDDMVEAMYKDIKGEHKRVIAIGGGTYVHNLKNGVAFGAALPETENHMHGPDEFAVVDELTMSAKIFAQVIVDLCC